jgi:lysophospholipase L1-like esterase
VLSLRSTTRAVLAAAIAGALALALTAGPAAAAGANYVALGDSYSSGVGAGNYTSDSGSCDRSTNAYSYLWKTAHSPASYVSVACSGATTASVNSSQISALTGATTLVSITVGGNDVGFATIMQTCVLQGTSACVAAVNAAEAKANSALAGLLGGTYSRIRSAAPNAHVVVLGYPVFYDLSKSLCIGLSGTSRSKIDEGINLVDGIIAATAGSYGFSYGDVRSTFGSHEICDSSSWLHSLNFLDLTESYHPTAAGQSGGYYPVFNSLAG